MHIMTKIGITVTLLGGFWISPAISASSAAFFFIKDAEVTSQAEFPPAPKNKLTKIQSGPNSTVFLMQLNAPVPPHLHKTHDEYFIVKQGKGTLYIKETSGQPFKVRLEKGDVFHIPMGLEHAFIPDKAQEVRGLGHYSPAWTTPDRQGVDWGKAWNPTP